VALVSLPKRNVLLERELMHILSCGKTPLLEASQPGKAAVRQMV